MKSSSLFLKPGKNDRALVKKNSSQALASGFRILEMCNETEQMSSTVAGQLRANTAKLARLETNLKKTDDDLNQIKLNLDELEVSCWCWTSFTKKISKKSHSEKKFGALDDSKKFFSNKKRLLYCFKFKSEKEIVSESEPEIFATSNITNLPVLSSSKVDESYQESTSKLKKIKSFIFSNRFSLIKKTSVSEVKNSKILKEQLTKAGTCVNNMLNDANLMSEQILKNETLINNLLNQSHSISDKLDRVDTTCKRILKKSFL